MVAKFRPFGLSKSGSNWNQAGTTFPQGARRSHLSIPRGPKRRLAIQINVHAVATPHYKSLQSLFNYLMYSGREVIERMSSPVDERFFMSYNNLVGKDLEETLDNANLVLSNSVTATHFIA